MWFTSTATRAGFIILPAMLLLLAACAFAPAPETGTVEAETLDEDEGVVFGTVEPEYYDSKGKRLTGNAIPAIDYEIFYGTVQNIGVKRTFSGFADSISGTTRQPQTFFAMRLAAGDYTFFKLTRPFPGTSGTILSDVRFTVTSQKATYIGALQVEFRANRGVFGQERVGEKVVFKVSENMDDAAKLFKGRNPDAGFPVDTNLMKVRRVK